MDFTGEDMLKYSGVFIDDDEDDNFDDEDDYLNM